MTKDVSRMTHAKCIECNKLIPLEEYYYGHDCEPEEEIVLDSFWSNK